MKGNIGGNPKKGMVGPSSRVMPETAGSKKNRLPNGVKGMKVKGVKGVMFPADIKR